MYLLVSAGATRERIDAVRFITNFSSGKMGYAIAAEAARRGCRVTLVSGATALPPPEGVELVQIESAADMAREIKSRANAADAIIMAAAVADYRPKHPLARKMKKTSGDLVLELERTEDILATLGAAKRPGQILVGFAAETDDVAANALSKLRRKNLDFIAANDVSRSDRGFGGENNAVTLYSSDGGAMEIPLSSKHAVAAALLDRIGIGRK